MRYAPLFWCFWLYKIESGSFVSLHSSQFFSVGFSPTVCCWCCWSCFAISIFRNDFIVLFVLYGVQFQFNLFTAKFTCLFHRHSAIPLLQQHNIVCGLLSGTWFGFLSGVWERVVLPAVWSIGFSQNSSTHECMQYVNDVNRYAISPLVDARSSHLQFAVAIIYFIPIVTVETARM